MKSTWSLHLQRRVIEDGEPELHVGDVFDWPQTFWSDKVLIRTPDRSKSAIPLADNCYHINAEVIYISRDPAQGGCIVDFGVQAVSEVGGLLGVPLPPECEEGDYV